MSEDTQAAEGGNFALPESDAAQAAAEHRTMMAPLTHIDVRDATESHGYWTMSGYAAVFDQSTTLYDGKRVRLTESIAPDAFRNCLANQGMNSASGAVHFNLNHNMDSAVAATNVPAGQPGSLQLRADDHGLFFLAKVPSDDPDGVRLAAKMRSGVVSQASFAFTVASDELDFVEGEDGQPDTEHRTITGIKRLYDVCATPQGAYPQTVAQLRSLWAATASPESREAITRQPEQGDGTPASPTGGDGASPDNKATQEERDELLALVARRRAIRAGFPVREKTSE